MEEHDWSFFILGFWGFFPPLFLSFVLCQDIAQSAETQLRPGKVVLMPLASAPAEGWEGDELFAEETDFSGKVL